MNRKGSRTDRNGRGRIFAARLLSGASLTAVGLMALASPLRAQEDRYWDPNGTAVNRGGSGTWDTSSSSWSPTGDGVSGPYAPWSNAGVDNAIFGGPNGTNATVTLGTPITAHNLTFDLNTTYTLNGSTLTLAGITPTVTTNGNATINSILAGTAGLTKAGSGTLTLNGANTFSGGLNVTAGRLTVSDDSALGAASNSVVLSSGASLLSTGALSSDRTVTLLSGSAAIGGGVGSARITGAGGLSLIGHTTLNNDSNDFTGPVGTDGFNLTFTSIGNLGEASALGSPTTAADGAIFVRRATAYYVGSGDTSDRDWTMAPSTSGSALSNRGTGTLTITGNIVGFGGFAQVIHLEAQTADLDLQGVISSNLEARPFLFSGGGTSRSITLGGANTFGGRTAIQNVTVRASSLADIGSASSLGTGAGDSTVFLTNASLSYIGAGDSSNRGLSVSGGGGLLNDGTGTLALSGAIALNNGSILTLGGSFAGDNTLSGVISGNGALTMNGAAGSVWLLGGTNTYTGATTVTGGTLQAGSGQAFGVAGAMIVNGGTLDLNNNDVSVTSLAGTGGSVALSGADLTVLGSTSASYSGSITGSGSLVKRGTGTLTLAGQSTYTGDTIVNGGTLALNFAAAGAPAADIISNASTLNMAGGTLTLTGAAGVANSQTFDGLNVTAGNNRIVATSGAGGSMTLDLGALTRTGGLMDFTLPASGAITTTNGDGALGWATVNGADYAQIQAGSITAFTAYANKDDASTWQTGDIVSDEGGAANTPYSNTVTGNVQLGGLKYTAAANSTVTLGGGNTLGVDGTIIVAASIGNASQTITGGSITGGASGSTLGILHNGAGTGTFTVASTIVDNGAATDFVKGGTGRVSLTGVNTYTGGTTLSGGTLVVNSIADGGVASSIGASTADSANLVIESGTLQYTGGTTTTDRGFTLVNGGPSRTIQVDNGGANLTFSGLVVGPDDAGLTKAGAGTLTLANAANTYTGVTTVSGGTLSVGTLANGGAASGIGASTADSANLVLQGGGGLQYSGGTVSSDRGFTLATGNGRIDVSNAAATLTLSGLATGAGTLVKEGAGTLVLSGANTYTGGTTVSAGTLRAGSAQAFGSQTALMTVNSGATLDLDGFANRVGALAGGGTVVLGSATLTTSGNTATFAGTISGSGGFTRAAGGGIQIFSGCGNSYAGATTIINAAIATDCMANGGLASGIGASSAASSNLVLQSGGLLQYTGGTVSSNRGFTLASGNGRFDVSNAAATLTFSGVATGGGTLVKEGAGTLVLSGTNTYSGGTWVTAGTLRAGSTSAFGSGGLTFSNTAGATLDLASFNNTVGFMNGGGALGGNIILGAGTLTLNLAGGTAGYAGAISGSGGLVKTGGLYQGLTGCNSTYTGSTTISGGWLAVSCLSDGGAASSIGSASATAGNLLINGGTLSYVGAGSSTDRLFTLGASATSKIEASGTGAVAFTNAGAIAFSSPNTAQTIRLGGTNTHDNSLAAQITNNGTGATSLTKEDSGTWILGSSNSTYTGITTINGGVLGVDKLANGGVASSIGASSAAASNLVIGNNSTLRYTGAGDSTNRLFTLSAGVTFLESSGSGAIVFTDTGPVTLSGANQARTIALGGTNTGNNTLAGSIGNAGTGITTLAKNDAGTWLLTGTNSYTGLTNINAGALILGNGGTTGSIASATVNNLGTLGFDRSNTLTYSGVIQGTGAVSQLGAGTTVLTGASTYTGGTTIGAGTLQLGNGGATGSIVGNVTNNGTLAFNRNDAYTFGGIVSGTGQVSQIGTGTTILTGTNTYGGGTQITAGTLQVSSNANLGSASGGLTFNGGTLRTTASFAAARAVTLAGAGTFLTDAGATLTLSGAVAGAGTLTKTGAGTLTLTANNNYTGLTTVSAGTLQIGNGGTTGSIAGNILNNSALVFDRSNMLTHGGTIIGSGSVTQAGPGTTILTGANSYAGATNVDGGTLLINGNQSGATGLTTVFNGATLGGSGTIGGGVLVENGGTLSPGNSPGVLTINGDLLLNAGSILDFELGQANVPGGPLNDLIEVGGNLVLDGTINVTQAAGGSFGPGVYRIINYAGALTDNGLTIGTLPAGSSAFVQTAIANQINLVNTAGLTLNFWDGAAGPKNDGSIQGGDGTWRLDGGQNNWTDVDGVVNADYAQDSFAIFQGTGGTVTVDNSGGGVLAAGMQFTVGGYTITGDALTLTGTEAFVRVGDGTAGDAGLIATIDAELTGAAQLVKDLGGTLVLTGANSYTGGTAINGGTLAISSDANLGDAAGGLSFDGGTLNTSASFGSNRAVALVGAGTFVADTGTTLTLDGTVSGAGALIKDGAGSLVLTAANGYAGGTTIGAGTLQLGAGGTTGSILGNVVNDGVLAFNRSNGLTFAGTITGSGSVDQVGTGTTILTADNIYTGGTTIGAGTLQLGAGGTSGGIVGDVANDAELAFNRSDEVTFAGLISGTGAVSQIGSGTTILTGNNSYQGATDVGSGTLLVNGDQTGATGLTSVASGATLGGTGTIGGDVTLAGGATLAPGQDGPGTLTINGSLSLAAGTALAYDFGQSDVVGGPLNDLTQVGGDLTLDGAIDVTVAPGGSFGPGLYRVISYGGTLTDNGFAPGTMPPGTLVAVQTSIAGQVNLINATGATLNFWDGAAGPKNDGAVSGGDGIWQNSGGNDNWTEIGGVVNGPYADASFAIFAAAPGTVSIDGSLGAVSASGLQFASDGYTITGDALTLVGPESVIRVGDGTADGLGYTATIASALAGATRLVKADLGTLILTGTNSYSGGTRIDVGTLRISSDANLGDVAGVLSFGGGTLNTTADLSSSRGVELIGTGRFLTDGGTTLALNGAIVGAGGLTKSGAGSLILAGSNSYAGDTSVAAGTLFVNGDQSAAMGAMAVASGATLGGAGIIGGNVTIADGATLAPGVGGVGTLTINGNLALGAGSILDFQFGEANVAGGTLNDLVNVGGDLTLAGTINVSVSTGGSFGPGIYRVFNYGGTLTDNGLVPGTLPGGSTISVQTAVAGQVNLVNTAGLTLGFWDGDVGPKNDGTINGGDGIWRVGGGQNNWTDASGSPNADYAQDSFAIFSAAPGTVTIDNSGGDVLASGLQFASHGYTIGGDALTLTGSQAIVQVGDGSAAGAGYVATIDAQLTGAAGLVKTDAGTLVLTGANSYAGGTTISGGMIRISSDANLGAAAGELTLDGGALNTIADIGSNRAVNLAGAGTFLTDPGSSLTLGGIVSGAGALTKGGAGTLVLTGVNSYAGGTTIGAGTLQIGDGGTSGSISGDVTNDGALAFNRSDEVTFAGAVSGGGSLSQIGSGTVILTADSSYAGGTTIAAGTLQLGNGGTTGSIAGNVVNEGVLSFNRSNDLIFAGAISGSGSIVQQGMGTTTLVGSHSYSGATNVGAGTLLINGDQSAATGTTSVASGATIGGTGTIGGDVVVADGGTLAPGAGGAGTLSINGNLALSGGSVLAYDFGAANAPGSPFNDVVNVGGDLTLDGTINVSVAAGGAFDIGLYRIANYGGVLTDNGLALGTLPAGADAFVQTSVAGQVNLINSGGAALNFWDGAAGPKFDGAVNGGDGVWQAGSGNDNWADATGAVNAAYDDGAFAVFTGAAGTVAVDNGLGAVTATGLQFATDGYVIGGETLTLAGAQSVIRVGDGTAPGADYTATIGAELAGAAQLVKTDLGILVLTGVNSYTGGTAINGGTLRIASDANLGAGAGSLSFDGGTLNTTADLTVARTVELAATGAFLVDAGTTLILGGAVSGAGGLAKSGAGTLVLAGAGSHAGATSVDAGTLLVNGNFGAATGAMTIASGAALGGTGTIGGNVSLASGATLTPGAGGAGTLTIDGDLSLAGGTILAYEFGQAGTAGGALNDLVNVGGDLVLDGTLNVTVPGGGAFDVGVYRLFNYGGTLTDNGLALGTLPMGSDAAVQTAVAGQVNLVNSAGLTLNFWDGAAGPKNNGVIDGGTGTWQNGAGSDNWTDAGGTVNAPYSNGAFAIFGGTGGTVTVDNGSGQVTAAGLQFAADGYTIAGDAVALTGPQATIRVGDGSAAGAGFTATISSVLAGDTQLVKTDAGSLVLSGANSYTGGTLINGGTVRITADANLGAAAGGVRLDGGTLAIDAAVTSGRTVTLSGAGTILTAEATIFTLDGQLSGAGALTKAGTGTMLLTGDSSGYGGTTTVAAGTLAVTGRLGGTVAVGGGSRLEGTGSVGSVANAGTVAPGGDGFGTLTVEGSYAGSGGTLEIDTVLGGDASETDRLVVTNGTTGTTRLVVANRGGLGAQTVEGIKIIDVTGGTSAGTFVLSGDYDFEGSPAVIAGAYGYRLFQGGVSTPADGDWYLRSALLDGSGEPEGPLYQPGVPVYESYAGTLQKLNGLPTLQERVGTRQWSGFTRSGIGMWGRIEGARHRPDAAVSTSGADVDTDTWGLQFGFDAAIADVDAGVLIAGVNGRYGNARTRVRSRFGDGRIETDGVGVGATLTWYGSGGFYADVQAQLSWYDGDLASAVLGSLAGDNDGSGEAFSLEIGQRLPLGASLSLTPQAQIVYSDVRFDGFADPNDAIVSARDGASLRGRVGLSLDHQRTWTQTNGGTARNHVYGIVNLDYEMLDGTDVEVSGTSLLRRDRRLRGEIGLGVSHSWADGRFTLFSEVSANTALSDFGDSNSLRGNAGFRMRF